MRAALTRWCRRLHLACLRARWVQLRTAAQGALLDPTPASAHAAADYLLQSTALHARIRDLESRSTAPALESRL